MTLIAGAAFAQDKQPAPHEKPQAKQKEKPPITKQELLTVLQSGGVAPERLLALVKERGVDFQSSITDEAELGRAGASPELVEAISANYRPRKKSFAEKFNAAMGAPKGATQAGVNAGDATQGASLNTPGGDATNAAAQGAANPPAKTLAESIKELKDSTSSLKRRSRRRPTRTLNPRSRQPRRRRPRRRPATRRRPTQHLLRPVKSRRVARVIRKIHAPRKQGRGSGIRRRQRLMPRIRPANIHPLCVESRQGA
jgi:hypothetical protein